MKILGFFCVASLRRGARFLLSGYFFVASLRLCARIPFSWCCVVASWRENFFCLNHRLHGLEDYTDFKSGEGFSIASLRLCARIPFSWCCVVASWRENFFCFAALRGILFMISRERAEPLFYKPPLQGLGKILDAERDLTNIKI